MKRILFFAVIIMLLGSLYAETNPLNTYFESPSAVTFTAAYNFCADKLAQDSTQVSYKILMANLAVMESNRIAEDIYPQVDNLEAGGKFQFANLLLAQNKFEEAIDIYSDLNLNYSTWSCPWRHKGQALYNLKRYKDAETSLTKAIETNTEHYDAYVWMARTQFELKKYKAALKNLETAMSLNPQAEESSDEVISDQSISALHEQLLKKTGKTK